MQHLDLLGASIPVLGLGTWDLKGDNAYRMTKAMLDHGYTHIDTAQAYDNEDQIGRGIKRSDIDREQLFLTTKVWHTNYTEDKFIPSVEESLRKLKTDYVDLLLLHWPHGEMPISDYLGHLVRAQERGMARYIGVSNFLPEQVHEVFSLGATIVTNQVEYHPYLNQDPVHQVLQEYNIALTAYSPLGRGEVMQDEVLEDIGSRYGKSAAQVALRWLLQQPDVIAVPKTKSVAHLMSNFDVFDFELSGEEMDAISELRRRNDKMVDPDFAPDWEYQSY